VEVTGWPARGRISLGQVAVVAVLLILAGLGWLVTGARMAGMDAGPWADPGAFGFYVTVWVVMMAAMMLPSAAPMVVAHTVVQRRRRSLRGLGEWGRTAAFVGGYLLAWTAFGVVAYALFEAARSLDVGALDWDRGGPYAAAAVLTLAAVYQLTPLKDACLARCRSPFAFLAGAWRPGRLGDLRMGAEHGAWCIGCCWALMVALFALGLMSLAWMAFIAALIAAEKLLPWGRAGNRAIALILIALAVWVVLAPDSVPGVPAPDAMDMHMPAMGG